ncbi:hypothetical protein BsIDN1_68090 [Bacillus safensis]|uniref:Uncharacterized protein n=1 Tax=Bacillus safensis TaxID=561879 RepID=A0A5S9MJR4_BACIA|nr:hypothetical protein BsIDN1_68090 [Bacillus safensis]
MIKKKQEIAFFKKSFQIAMVLALISGLGVAFSGHDQAKHLMKSQPMKMAASEALWKDSGDPAAWTLFANIDTNKKKKTLRRSIFRLL